MSSFTPVPLRLPYGNGAASGALRPGLFAGRPIAAEANDIISTRTRKARALEAAPLSLFERAHRRPHGTARRAWRLFNDNAHADRRAPPGRDPGGRRQGKPDRGT